MQLTSQEDRMQTCISCQLLSNAFSLPFPKTTKIQFLVISRQLFSGRTESYPEHRSCVSSSDKLGKLLECGPHHQEKSRWRSFNFWPEKFYAFAEKIKNDVEVSVYMKYFQTLKNKTKWTMGSGNRVEELKEALRERILSKKQNILHGNYKWKN